MSGRTPHSRLHSLFISAVLKLLLVFCLGMSDIRENESIHEYAEFDGVDRNAEDVIHRDTVNRLVHIPHGDRYLTCSRDGTIRFWNSKDLLHQRTLKVGSLKP